MTLHFLRCSSNCPIAELLTAALCTALRTTIGSRPRREGSNLRELPTKRTRTAGSRNVLPRLLTSLHAMVAIRHTRTSQRRPTERTEKSQKVLFEIECHAQPRNNGSSNNCQRGIFAGSKVARSFSMLSYHFPVLED